MSSDFNINSKPIIAPAQAPAAKPAAKTSAVPEFGSPMASNGLDQVSFSANSVFSTATQAASASQINLRDPNFNMDRYLKTNPQAAAMANRFQGTFSETKTQARAELNKSGLKNLSKSDWFSDLVSARALDLTEEG